MRIILLILTLISITFSCGNPWKMVFTNDGRLARLQDSLIDVYNKSIAESCSTSVTIDKDLLRELKINEWVRQAYKVAPGNLIIRQYCLIDLFENKPSHNKKIKHLVNIISSGGKDYPYADWPKSKYRGWFESYTYFLYTKNILVPWIKKYNNDETVKDIEKMISQVDSGFAVTAYLRYTPMGSDFRPAVFGDLWDHPLDSIGQIIAKNTNVYGTDVQVMNMKRIFKENGLVYEIKKVPLGLNGHPPKEGYTVKIIGGMPDTNVFKYYQGYDKKYKDVKAEWKDLLNPVRLFTVPFIW